MQRRTLHADEFRCSGDVAAEAQHLRIQILAFKGLPRRAQGQGHEIGNPGTGQHGRAFTGDIGRQHVRAHDPVALERCHDHDPLHDVAQLAHVAGPGVGLQHGERVATEFQRLLPRLGRQPIEEGPRQISDILGAAGQPGDFDLDHVQAVVQVFAEQAFVDQRLQVAVRGRDDPDIGPDFRGAAQLGQRAPVQEPCEPRLRVGREITHVVEQQRAAVGLLDHAHHRRALAGAGVAEQHGQTFFTVEFEAWNLDERLVGAVGLVVHHPGDQALARARRAGNHQAAVGRRHPVDGLTQGLNGVAAADQVGVFACLLPQHRVFGLQRRGLKRALDQDQQPVGVEGLFDEVISALLDRAHGGLDRAVTGHHDHQRRGNALLIFFEQGDTIGGRTLQPDILKNQIGAGQTHLPTGLSVTMRSPDPVALVLQNAAEQHADIGFIVYDQYVGGHQSPS